jgi:hypothetical protein
VSIDVECDKDPKWCVRWPLTFRGVEEGIGERLNPLFAEYGVRPTYLLSPEVMRHADSVAVLRESGACELGTHLHPEFVRSSARVGATAMVASQMAEEHERKDIEDLTTLFAETFGVRPMSYRAGRYGASARSIGILAKAGYQVDTSVTPHKQWDYGLDFRRAPASPYFPAAGDVDRPGPPGGVLEIPVTLRPSPAPAAVREATAQLARLRLEPLRRIAKWARGPAWFRPGWSTRRMLFTIMREVAAGGTEGPYGGVLNMMFHNVDMVAGMSPTAATEVAVLSALDDLRAVLEQASAQGGRFVTLSELRNTVVQRWPTP